MLQKSWASWKALNSQFMRIRPLGWHFFPATRGRFLVTSKLSFSQFGLLFCTNLWQKSWTSVNWEFRRHRWIDFQSNLQSKLQTAQTNIWEIDPSRHWHLLTGSTAFLLPSANTLNLVHTVWSLRVCEEIQNLKCQCRMNGPHYFGCLHAKSKLHIKKCSGKLQNIYNII